MKIEIVEFYPSDKQSPCTLQGTLHIYVIDKGMNVRGVGILKDKRGKWFVQMPYRWGVDQDTKKACRYPIVNFTLARENKDLIQAIKKQGSKYVEDMLKGEKC